MNLLRHLATLFLFMFSFSSFAQNICDSFQPAERNGQFFIYGLEIDQTQFNQQIDFQVALAHHFACLEDNTNYQLVDTFTQNKRDFESQIAAATDPEKKKELSSKLDNNNVLLTQFTKKRDALKTALTSACTIPVTVPADDGQGSPNCFSLLKQQLEFEIQKYPDNTADADVNSKNQYKSKLAASDLKIIENLFNPKEDLEKSPSSILLLKNQITDSNFFGGNTNVLLDILSTKSAEIAIFRQKIKVLERNSRILLNKIGFGKECWDKYVENKIKGDICYRTTDLYQELNRTLELSYDDSWFENRNIESDIKHIESLAEKLNKLMPMTSTNTSTVQQLNYLNHANEYFAKYNGTGRYNIGLGAALFNSPDIVSPVDYTLDLSQFTASTLDSQTLQDELNIPSGKKLSPVIVATMPWFDVTLTLPAYSRNSTFISDIQNWELPIVDDQTQHRFLSRTTIESHTQIDYDLNLTLKIFNFLRDICTYDCYLGNLIKNKNIDLAIGVGTTDMQLTKTYHTDIREQINANGGFAQLASLHEIDEIEKIDHSLPYAYFGVHYYMADQIRLEGYWKRYRSEYKEGTIQLTSKDTWGISIAYLFF